MVFNMKRPIIKGTPFKTRRTSPFMEANQGLVGEALQQPELAQEPVALQEPNSASQMQSSLSGDDDKDKWAAKVALYNTELDYAATEYGDSSVEDIRAVMEQSQINPYDIDAEKVFDYSGKNMGDHSILGDDAEIADGHGWRMTSKGVKGKVFPYGNIRSVKQDDGSYIETINITAKNHPLYGNTYTRTRTSNKERGTIKPIEDLSSVLSNYNYDNREATIGIFSISTKGEKPKWHFTADSDFEQAIKEGWLTNKDGSTLLPWQITELESEFKRASDRFKGLEVTSTKLNDK